eukprot:1195313-Prorocentrum_minimum.AAC.1
MARGVDFVGVASVLNLDFPSDPIAYIHRIGRTGRAGQTGGSVDLRLHPRSGEHPTPNPLTSIVCNSRLAVVRYIAPTRPLSEPRKPSMASQAV